MEEAAARRVSRPPPRTPLRVDLKQVGPTAPFAGTIAVRSVDEGAVVSAGAPVVEILESGAPIGESACPPRPQPGLSVGGRAALVVDGRNVPARVSCVAP